MPLLITCGCGKQLKASEELIGRRVKCPACKSAITVKASLQADATAEPTKQAQSPPSRRASAKPADLIKLTCDCGSTIGARREHVGRKVKCPKCGASHLVAADSNDSPANTETKVPSPSLGELIRVTCTCGSTIGARKERVGRTVKCPKCGASTLVRIPPPENSLVDLLDELDQSEDEASTVLNRLPAAQARTRISVSFSSDGRQALLFGVWLNYVGIGVQVVAVLLTIALLVLRPGSLAIGGYTYVAGALSGFAGRVVCLLGSRDPVSLGLIVTTLVLDVAKLAALNPALQFVTGFSECAFVVFIRYVGRRDADVRNSASTVLALLVAVVAVSIFWGAGLLSSLASLLAFFAYLRLLNVTCSYLGK